MQLRVFPSGDASITLVVWPAVDRMRELLSIVAGLLLAAQANAGSSSTAKVYSAPSLTAGLAASDQAYQIGIWSFVLFSVVMAMAVYAVGGMDYSQDTLLHVEVEQTATEHRE